MRAADDSGDAGKENRPSMAEWLRGTGALHDVVLSSRVRAARNLAGFPFLTTASRVDRSQILDMCKRRLLAIRSSIEPETEPKSSADKSRVAWVDLHTSSVEERDLLVERQLISRNHAKGKLSTGSGGPDEPRGVAVVIPDERVSVMVNEEDHLRIQSVRSGLDLGTCLGEVDTIDDELEKGLDFAFHPRFGYLTACPTNVGTGLRLSVMMHLPGLKMAGELDKARRAAHDMGLAVRGFYGEGSEAAGEFYQVSNQTTLGKSDKLLLSDLAEDIVPRLAGYEMHARKRLLKSRKDSTHDTVGRALGVLRHARLLRLPEAMDLLGTVRFGIVTGLINDVPIEMLHGLLLSVQPAHLQRVVGRAMSQHERRTARADHCRAVLGVR